MGSSERSRDAARLAAVDAVRLVTAATNEDFPLERELCALFLADEERRAELVLISLAAMLAQLVTRMAARGREPVEMVLARMMDGALR